MSSTPNEADDLLSDISFAFEVFDYLDNNSFHMVNGFRKMYGKKELMQKLISKYKCSNKVAKEILDIFYYILNNPIVY